MDGKWIDCKVAEDRRHLHGVGGLAGAGLIPGKDGSNDSFHGGIGFSGGTTMHGGIKVPKMQEAALQSGKVSGLMFDPNKLAQDDYDPNAANWATVMSMMSALPPLDADKDNSISITPVPKSAAPTPDPMMQQMMAMQNMMMGGQAAGSNGAVPKAGARPAPY